jgi:pepF/M3 family oligoendopeptidase
MSRDQLPRWDLTPAFPAPDSPELEAAFAELRRRADELDGLLGEAPDGGDAAGPFLERLLAAWNGLEELREQVSSFLYSWTTADTHDQAGQTKLSELQEMGSAFDVLRVRTDAWIGAQDIDRLIASSPVAADHAYFLHRASIGAAHQMSLPEEELAARLRPGAGSAWERLRDDIETRLAAKLEVDGETKVRPITEIRNLRSHAQRDTRRRAYETELGLWEQGAIPIAASVNGIKNEALVLAERRGWADPLDTSLFQNAIDRQVLEAILAACEEIAPELHGHMRRRARMLGEEQLAWYDLSAPLGETATTYTWEEACDVVTSTLGGFSPRLAAMLERAFTERWIDAEPRPGKIGGAYCTEFYPHGSRVLMNFEGSVDSLSTLAHELGHAYHNECLAHRTPLQRTSPMTLAETASMMLQHLLEDVLLERAAAEDRLAMLNARLNDAVALVLDLRARLEFEQRLFEGRRKRALTVEELCELTLESQAMAFGDGLDAERRHAYRWAATPHYYIIDLHYYNYPYQFGMLFALGLYAQYLADRSGFVERYEELLSRTGMASAPELATGFGMDLHDIAFWRSGLDTVRSDIAAFAALAPVAVS